MTDSERRILQMLDENKISVDEAARLLEAVRKTGEPDPMNADDRRARREKPKYIRVQVQPSGTAPEASDVQHVNIRVPMALLHAGMKLSSLIPSQAATQVNEALHDKGINIDVRSFKPEQLEQIVDALCDLEVDVKNGKEKVHIYVE